MPFTAQLRDRMGMDLIWRRGCSRRCNCSGRWRSRSRSRSRGSMQHVASAAKQMSGLAKWDAVFTPHAANLPVWSSKDPARWQLTQMIVIKCWTCVEAHVAAISSSRNRRRGRWRRHFSMSTQRAAAFDQKERNRKAKTSAKSVRNSEFDIL